MDEAQARSRLFAPQVPPDAHGGRCSDTKAEVSYKGPLATKVGNEAAMRGDLDHSVSHTQGRADITYDPVGPVQFARAERPAAEKR